MKTCGRYNRAIPADFRFCQYCGALFGIQPSESIVSNSSAAPSEGTSLDCDDSIASLRDGTRHDRAAFAAKSNVPREAGNSGLIFWSVVMVWANILLSVSWPIGAILYSIPGIAAFIQEARVGTARRSEAKKLLKSSKVWNFVGLF